jgi:hypothetical protein
VADLGAEGGAVATGAAEVLEVVAADLAVSEADLLAAVVLAAVGRRAGTGDTIGI